MSEIQWELAMVFVWTIQLRIPFHKRMLRWEHQSSRLILEHSSEPNKLSILTLKAFTAAKICFIKSVRSNSPGNRILSSMIGNKPISKNHFLSKRMTCNTTMPAIHLYHSLTHKQTRLALHYDKSNPAPELIA